MNGPVARWFETSRGSGVILILLLLGFWQFSALYIMNTPTWPPVTTIFTAWYESVADGTLIPKGHEAYYAEKVVRLPDSYQANDSTRAIPEKALTRRDAGLPADGFVFC